MQSVAPYESSLLGLFNMSFGFSATDFVQVGQLAWTLYRECYKVARGAPQEFQLLVGEISTLSNSLTILQEEVKDPESTIVQAGEDRWVQF